MPHARVDLWTRPVGLGKPKSHRTHIAKQDTRWLDYTRTLEGICRTNKHRN